MLWFLIVWPPLAFLLVIVAASGVAVRAGATSAESVEAYVKPRIPALLAITLAVVGLSLVALLAGSDAVWQGIRRALDSDAWGQSAAVGGVVGAAVAGVYFGGLDRTVRLAQDRLGDYVPAGSTTSLGAGGTAFFVANVVLAPLVEEIWYRGLLFDSLTADFGAAAATVVGCAAFGLFHWPGGAWYVLVTGVLVGGACWTLRAWSGDLVAPYVAHLTLNAIEYVVLTRAARRSDPRPAAGGQRF